MGLMLVGRMGEVEDIRTVGRAVTIALTRARTDMKIFILDDGGDCMLDTRVVTKAVEWRDREVEEKIDD